MKASTQNRLYRLSRDTSFLLKASVTLGLLFIALAMVIGKFSESSEATSTPDDLMKAIEDASNAPGDAQLMASHLVRSVATILARGTSSGPEPLIAVISGWKLEAETEDCFRLYARASLGTPEEAKPALAELLTRATNAPPSRFANALAGDLAWAEGNREMALALFHTEVAQFDESDFARHRVIELLTGAKDSATLVKIINDPLYRVSGHALIKIGILLKDPQLILQGVLAHESQAHNQWLWPITLAACAVWFLIILKLVYVDDYTSPTVFVGLAGIGLGWFSAIATLFVVILQEDLYAVHLKENGELLNDTLYYICGVGLREEVVKWLFFLPLTPWLYRARDPRLVIVAASAVGLGFAIQENIGYADNAGIGTGSRLVTANFLHIALTGVLGFAWCRFLYTPRREWERFIGTFIGVIVVHGVYDVLISLNGGIVSIAVFALFVNYYLTLVSKHCPPTRQIVSPLGVFVIGCVCVLGLSLITSAAVSGSAYQAILAVWGEALSMFPLMFLYINHFREI